MKLSVALCIVLAAPSAAFVVRAPPPATSSASALYVGTDDDVSTEDGWLRWSAMAEVPSKENTAASSSTPPSSTSAVQEGTEDGEDGWLRWSSMAEVPSKEATTAMVAPPKENMAASSSAPLFVDATRSSVQNYYGTNLQTSDDLATNACCTAGAPPKHIQECIANLHPETVSKYYGCGLCLPDYNLAGLNVLDLGCGAGRDVYIASQLVGPTGRVVGVDMTPQQLEAARKHQPHHAEKFGFDNVQFLEGYLEQLDELKQLEEGSFDLIVSNCVLNLCTDKQAVLESCHKLLKEGGEMYFSDVYASRRVPMELQQNEILWGECLSGALYWNDFENMAVRAGFGDPRLVEDAPITIQNATVQALVDSTRSAGLAFYSATYRLWKIAELEPACEDFGQAVTYRGTIARAPSFWKLDKGHVFEAGKIHPVCGNTWNMLEKTAVKDHFEFTGDFSRHYGIFEGCGSSMPYDRVAASSGKGSSESSGGGCC